MPFRFCMRETFSDIGVLLLFFKYNIITEGFGANGRFCSPSGSGTMNVFALALLKKPVFVRSPSFCAAPLACAATISISSTGRLIGAPVHK
jgi:hypothetical protein